MITTAKCAAPVAVRYVGPLTHLCPFVEEVDHGEVEIHWATDGRTIELHSLAAELATLAGERMSHEDVTERIYDRLANRLPGIRDVQVTTRWTTAGAQVEVTRALPGERLLSQGA